MSLPTKKTHEVTPEQLALFGAIVDGSFSNSIEFYDMLPKYLFAKRTAFREDDLPPEKHVIEREFTTVIRVAGKPEKKNCFIKLRPALVMRKKGDKLERWYAYPSHREMLVEEAIRKLAIEQGGYLTDGRVGCKFSITQVRKMLEETGHECRYSDIVEAINILNTCHMEYGFVEDNGRSKVSGRSSLFPEIFIRTREDYLAGDMDSAVQFHELVNKSIRERSFRNYDFLTCMRYRLALSNYLHKRITMRFKQAAVGESYSFYLSTIFSEGGFNSDQPLAKGIEQMKEALQELKDAGVVESFEYALVKDEKDKRRSKDASFDVYVTERFARQIVKINSQAKQIRGEQP